MKKTFIATLMIMVIASASIFAAVVSDADSFNVTTTIAEMGKVKVSIAAIAGNTLVAYNAAGDLTTYGISSSGDQTSFVAFLTTLSNKRTGYKVTMSATAMISGAGASAAYIDYTVGSGGQTVKTNGAGASTPSTAPTVMNVSSLPTLTGASQPITLSIDATTYDAAVAGDYTGTVTFNFVSNA